MKASETRKFGRTDLQVTLLDFATAPIGNIFTPSSDAAALQFVLAHPCISTNIPGTSTVAQLEQNIALIEPDIPAAFWQQPGHTSLIRADAPTP